MTTTLPAPEVITHGCRLNAGEADAIRLHARQAGLDNAVIVNTCAVTAEAVRQGRQEIRRLARSRPQARVIVTGCAAQIEPERFSAMPEVHAVVGNAEKMQQETWKAFAEHRTSGPVAVGDIMAEAVLRRPPLEAPAAIPRAFVQVQNGCDHRCTFCVIPFGRGRSRSLAPTDVVAHVRAHVERGVPEIVLTGVDITSWGRDLPGTPPLGRLVRQILREVPRLARLRLSSLDQAEIDNEMMTAIADEPRLMPHLHLSLQAGADLILKRMKRRHSRADAIAFARQVRRLRPDIALGADLIAGFPTETEDHFRDTLALVDECGLTFLHVFPYSARRDTPAARMPQVAAEVVRERAARLREKGRSVLEAWLSTLQGTRIGVALERAGGPVQPARTPQFVQVEVSGVPSTSSAGDTLRVRISGSAGGRLLAEALA